MNDRGAHFHKADLQVHSPRDLRWSGRRPTSHEERRAYANALVGACRQRGIEAIAITDHHDMAFVPFIRQAALEELRADGTPVPPEERLTVFPGMELTLGVPCQALIIFDAEFPDDLFALALAALAITPAPAEDPTTAQVQRLDRIHSLQALKDKLDEHAYLRGRYTVLPNVSDGGNATLLRSGNHGKYAEMPWEGGYVDGPFERVGQGNRDILAGRSAAHGNKKIAVFQTSDSRREDHNTLGAHVTWIKWAVPTAEALRQACLAPQSRISHVEPLLPQSVIESISVSNSKFLGPLDVTFSPQYTALIGGRGTGKSTILEYLRWALCDQPPSLQDDDTPRYEQRRQQLVEFTLKPFDAKVDVRCVVNGVLHHVRRDSKTNQVHLKIGTQDFRSCNEAELRAILPIQAYSQKQLSDVSVRLDELLRFVTTPIQGELEGVERQLRQVSDNIRTLYANKRRKSGIERQVQQGVLSASSVQQQLAALKESLPGLSEEDQITIGKSQLYAQAEQGAATWRRNLQEIEALARELSGKIEAGLGRSEYVCSHEELQVVARMCESYRQFLREAKSHADAVAAGSAALVADRQDGASIWAEWQQRLHAYRQRYEAALKQDSAQSQKLQQIAQLEARLGELQDETDRAQQLLQNLTSADIAFEMERDRQRDLLNSKAALLSQECAKLTAASSQIIKAEVRRNGDASAFVSTLREVSQGSSVQRAKLEGLGDAIVQSADPAGTLETLLDELEALAGFESTHEGREQLPQTPLLSSRGFTQNELRKLAGALTSDKWLQLLLTPLKEVPEFKYRTREGEYIPFSNASAGQQATALLKTLLNQEGPPLIIDQPEEDLDNPVILDIVAQLWQAKSNRQIIFASHNANLVVNGDAELVVWCDYRTSADQSRGTVADQGAIDVPTIREAIKTVMEGGAEAFNLRMRKYGF